MKKICFITTVHGTLRGFLLPYSKYLHANTDWEIHFVSSPDEEFEKSLPEYIHYHPISMKRGVSLDAVKVIPEMVRLFKKEKFDLIQYSTPNASFYASIAGKIAKVPVRLYCQWGMVFVSMKGPKKWLFRNVERFVCRNSTHIEPDSFGNLEFAQQQRLYPGWKGNVVWNGSTGGINLDTYDLSRKAQWRQEIRSAYNIPDDAVVFGFVGRITGDKGINELFTAFRKIKAQMPDAYLILTGGMEKQESLDLNLLQWAKSEPQVIFTGPQRNIQRYYSAMDVFVLPSYREGFGSVVIEAEAMEVPVIATDIPGPREAMSRDVTGLMVPKQDVDALADAMARLYSDKTLREALGKAGRSYVATRFEQKEFYRHTTEDRMRLMGLKKKICFITTVHGTIRRFIFPLIEYIHQHTDWEIHCICNPNEEFSAILPNYIHFHPISMKRGMNTDALFAVPKMIKIFRREKFDMIQYSTPNAGAYASVAGKIAKVPVRVYCMWGLVYVSMKGVRRRIFKSVERSVCARSTHIRPDSFGNLAFGEKEGLFPAGKAQVVYNGSSCGIDTDLFDIGQKQRWRKEIRSRFGIEETDKVFGFIGRITGDKGINELLEAFRGICGKMSDAKLLMVGNVELRDTLKPELLEWAQKHPQVIFTGHQPNSQELYAAMDVLVLPSYREGLCNVLIEAQVMGVAVITTEIPGTVEAINPEVTGLTVPAKDSRALSNAMERLYRDDDLRCRMGQKGPEFAKARYNRKLLMEHILDDRRKMLGEME